MANIKHIELFNETPTITNQQRIFKVTEPMIIKHCSKDLKTDSVQEFLEKAKNYSEVMVEIKPKSKGIYHWFYRCFFDNPKDADKAYKSLQTIYNERQKQLAQESYANGKYAEESQEW